MVLTLVASFLIYVMAPAARVAMDAYLALGADTLPSRPWQIATALLFERSAWGLLNIIGLWFAGAAVERALGTRRFLLLFFLSGLASNATVALLASPGTLMATVSGVGDSVLALIVAMAVLYRNTPLRIWGALALPARTLAIALIVISVVLTLRPGTWPLAGGTLAASLTAYFLAGGKGGGLKDFWTRWRHKARRSRYHVLDGGRAAGRKDYLN